MPIKAAGKIIKPSIESLEFVEDILEKFKGNFNTKKITRDEELKDSIFQYERLKANIYLLRFTGLDKYKGINLSAALFVDENDHISLKNDNVYVNDEQVQLTNDLNFISSQQIKGDLNIFNTGQARIHRKSLRPSKVRAIEPRIIYKESITLTEIKFLERLIENP